MGAQISRNGVNFEPSVGVSVTYNDKYKDRVRTQKKKNALNIYEIDYTDYGDLTVGYGEYSEGNPENRGVLRGVEIEIKYNSKIDLAGSYWMQEITTNDPNPIDKVRLKGINTKSLFYTYWDDGHGQRNGRYYTDKEMRNHTLNNGKTVTFYDTPSRVYCNSNSWKANLYLVYNNKAILTVTYGFTTQKGIPSRTGMIIYHHLNLSGYY